MARRDRLGRSRSRRLGRRASSLCAANCPMPGCRIRPSASARRSATMANSAQCWRLASISFPFPVLVPAPYGAGFLLPLARLRPVMKRSAQNRERGMAANFPDGFLWGTATAAHQVEGGNTSSDLWLMEMMPDSLFTEPSGDACDHYYLYPRDIALLKQLGFDTYRFSIEWARIEPEEGFFSKAALDHYRRMIAACLAEGVVPMVTFHHFTAPLWFTRDGGWENAKSVERFARYCEQAGRALGDIIDYACTINEANIPIMVTMMREAVGIGGRGDKREKALAERTRLCDNKTKKFSPY